jgi:hypothetical protein
VMPGRTRAYPRPAGAGAYVMSSASPVRELTVSALLSVAVSECGHAKSSASLTLSRGA